MISTRITIHLVFVLGTCIPSAYARALVDRVVTRRKDQYSQRHLAGRDDTVPGAITTPYPTLIHLAIEWEIKGDDNLNGRVDVRYRESHATFQSRQLLHRGQLRMNSSTSSPSICGGRRTRFCLLLMKNLTSTPRPSRSA